MSKFNSNEVVLARKPTMNNFNKAIIYEYNHDNSLVKIKWIDNNKYEWIINNPLHIKSIDKISSLTNESPNKRRRLSSDNSIVDDVNVYKSDKIATVINVNTSNALKSNNEIITTPNENKSNNFKTYSNNKSKKKPILNKESIETKLSSNSKERTSLLNKSEIIDLTQIDEIYEKSNNNSNTLVKSSTKSSILNDTSTTMQVEDDVNYFSIEDTIFYSNAISKDKNKVDDCNSIDNSVSESRRSSNSIDKNDSNKRLTSSKSVKVSKISSNSNLIDDDYIDSAVESISDVDFDSDSESDNVKVTNKSLKNSLESSGISKKECLDIVKVGEATLSNHCDILKPFVKPDIYNMLLKNSKENPIVSTPDKVSTQPTTISSKYAMRSYQIEGLNWLISQYYRGINSILADEMGLGKTFQTIAFITYLLHLKHEKGPHLVVCPLSVLQNWIIEFRKFSPSIKVLRLHGTGEENSEINRLKVIASDFKKTEVIICTYDTLKKGKFFGFLKKFVWRTVTLDEGHRIKNDSSLAWSRCSALLTRFKLILTGTPVQNNLHEMYSILNFLMPTVFTDSIPFDNSFQWNSDENKAIIDRSMLDKSHYLLRIFILRRLKNEVENTLPEKIETKINCPMSKMQQFWMKQLLLKEKDIIINSLGDKTHNNRLFNLMMHLRKVSNHPYLFRGVELISSDGMPTEEIITASGKMIVLDKLLKKLIEKNHRVVIFSQFTRTLDIISDYLDYRSYSHCRLDGNTSRVMREVNINLFNRPGSELQVFCLTTRAGGEGVNLYTADTAILFDSDWNPQVDIQAMARIHRIGQTKVVHVYRLITAGSVEEIILHRAQNKMFLDAMVNRGSTAQGIKLDEVNVGEDLNDTDEDIKNDDVDSHNIEIPSEEDVNDGTIEPSKLLSAIKFGWNNVFSLSGSNNLQDQTISDEDIELIISRNRNNDSESKDNEEKLSKLLQNQEKTISNFDESVGLVSIKDIESEFIKKNPKDITLDSIANDWRSITKPANEVINNSDIMSSFSTKSGRQIASRDFENQDFCQNCWEGGDLICCDFCPTSFHLKCLNEIKLPPPTDGPWKCSHHDCRKCFKKKGNFLFRCEICVDAYCETCLPVDASVKGPSKFFEALGFRTPKSACYILCSLECIDFANTRANDIIAEIYDNDESDNKIHKKTITTNYRTIIPTLDPVVVVEKCLLKDVKTRLTRYIDSSNAKFQSLKEIPNFEIRLRKAMASTVALLNSVIQQIKKKLNKNYTSDLESVDILDTIMNFEGLPYNCEYEYIAEVFLDVARALRNAVKSDLFGIIKIIGINEPVTIFNNRHKKIDEIEPDEFEPKFRYRISDSAKRALVEEAIASFLVIPHPQNLLIELSSSSASLPFSIDSLFYVFRLLQCLGEYSTDHQFMIATTVLRQNGKLYDKLREFKQINLAIEITVDVINKWTEPARRLCNCLTERDLENIPKKLIKEIMEIKKPKPVAVAVEPVKEGPKQVLSEDKPVMVVVEEVQSEINNQNEMWKTALNKSSRLFIMKAFKAYIRSLISINNQHENSMLTLVNTIDGLEKTHLINSKTLGAYTNIYNIMTLVHTILESKFDISYPKNLKYLSYDTLNEFAKQISEYFKSNLISNVNTNDLSIESKLPQTDTPNVESTNSNDNNDKTNTTIVSSSTTNNENKKLSVNSKDWKSTISKEVETKVKSIILYSLQLIKSLNITFNYNEKTVLFIEENYLKNCSSVEIYSHAQNLMNYLCVFYSNNLPKKFNSIKISQLSNFISKKKGQQYISNIDSISPIVRADKETLVKNATSNNDSISTKDISNDSNSSKTDKIDLTVANNTKIIPTSTNKQQVLNAFNQYIKLVSYNNFEWSKIYNDALIESMVKWLEKDHLLKCNTLTEYLDNNRIAEFAEIFIKEKLQHKDVKFPSRATFTNLLKEVVENKISTSDYDTINSNRSDQIPFETTESTRKSSNSQLITKIQPTTSHIPTNVTNQLVTNNNRIMPTTVTNQSNLILASRAMPTTSEPLAKTKQAIANHHQIPTTSMISVTAIPWNQTITDKSNDISIPNVKLAVQSIATQSNEGKCTDSDENDVQKSLHTSLSVVKRAPIICKIIEIIKNFLKCRYIQLSEDLSDNIVLQIDLFLLKKAKNLEEYVSMKTIQQRVLTSFHSFIRQGNGHLFNIDQLNKIIQGLNDTDNLESIEVQDIKSSASENIDNDSIYPFTNPINVNIRKEILFTLWSYPHYRSNYTYECLLNIVDSLEEIEDKNNFKWKRNITQDVRSYLVNNIIYTMMIQKAVQYNVLCSNPANCSVIFESNLFKYTTNLYTYLNVNKISELITSIMIYYAYDLKDQSINFVNTNISDKILSSTIDSFNIHGCAIVKRSNTLTNMALITPADSINKPFDSITPQSLYTGNAQSTIIRSSKNMTNSFSNAETRISPNTNISFNNFDVTKIGSSVNLNNITSARKIKPFNYA